MDIQKIIRRMYTLCRSYALETEVPIAFVNIVRGASCPFTEAELVAAYDKVKWDSCLSPSELVFEVAVSPAENSLTIVSLTEFEFEGKTRVIPVSNGSIDLTEN